MQKESALHLLLRFCGELYVFMKNLTGNTLEVESSDTIDNVKVLVWLVWVYMCDLSGERFRGLWLIIVEAPSNVLTLFLSFLFSYR
jgi:hypothetical protein